MSFWEYLYDHIYSLLLNIVCMVLLSVYLVATGNEPGSALLVVAVWLLLLAGCLLFGFLRRRRYLDRLWKTAEGLEQKYLLPEVMDKPYRSEDREYYELMHTACKSMLENVSSVRAERREYREYIEQWVHEVKMPIAAIKLMCDNNKSEFSRRILTELDKTDNYVEQALFYARSENVEKDYLVRELPLRESVNAVILRNKQLLLSNRVSVETAGLDLSVFTDRKWLEFILHQLVANAVKYRKGEGAVLRFSASEWREGVRLCVEDNGVGIAASELPRIFDKGFTGSNGRSGQRSTGIGLYLCKRLCDKLGLGLSAESVQGSYTRILLVFPKGTFSGPAVE